MAFVPDIKYADIITQLETLDTPIICGSKYTIEAFTSGFIDFGTVIHVDCSEFNQTVHNSAANALKKLVCIFKSGVAMYVDMWCETNQINGPVKVKIYTTTGPIYMEFQLSGTAAGGISFSCFPQDLKDHGLKFAFYTDYYDWTVVPVRGITPPYNFSGVCYAPLRAYSAGHADYYNMADTVQSNAHLLNSYDPDRPGTPALTNENTGPFEIPFLGTSNVDQWLSQTGYQDPTDGYEVGEMPDPDQPPQDYDPSQPGGGDGDYDPTSDPIAFPGLPTGGALHSGAIKAFVVTSGIMTAVFNELWNTSVFDIANWQKLLEAPLDSLIELSCVPFVPTTSGNGVIAFGNFETQQSAPVVSNQYLTIDCGSKTVNKFWGSALDYQPYTSVEIYLPFIGIRELKADDVVGYTIQVKYNIDILTGDLTAQIKCGQSVLYKFNGNCKATVPVSARVMDALRSFYTGTMGIALASTPTGVATATIAAAVNVAMSKTHVQRSGNIAGSPGLLDDFVPYLIIHRPKQSLAKNFNKQKGYPSNISALLSSLHGYTEVEYIHLTGISGATDTELDEIETLLKGGVII